MSNRKSNEGRLSIAVVGSGISGLAAAWLLSKRHDVTLFEKDARLGGHANTVSFEIGGGPVDVDTGFIVFNPLNYPNLTALFKLFDVETAASDMSFAVSMDGGRFEYGGGSFQSLFAQKRNLLRPAFWAMLSHLVRFYRDAPRQIAELQAHACSLGEFLENARYGKAFQNYHLLPMAGAIWSAAPDRLRDYPAAAFIRFFENHGLLNLTERPQWRTVVGGSQRYVEKLADAISGEKKVSAPVSRIIAYEDGVLLEEESGLQHRFQHVVIATHSDQALSLLDGGPDVLLDALGAIPYTPNRAVLHTDARLMPRRRTTWSSWNFIGCGNQQSSDVCVTYWMNKLQPLATDLDIFVTLNPPFEPAAGTVISEHVYHHPHYTLEGVAAQDTLKRENGRQNIWLCGAYLGSGFHEDGLKSGLEVAEAIGGTQRPWAPALDEESGRLVKL